MKISEIFRSIEGEGSRSGYLTTFIRTFGCPLSCSYCDSIYACKGNDYKDMTIDEIMNEVYRFRVRKVTATGGEPLIQPEMHDLITRLSKEGYEVNIETSGAVDYTDYIYMKNVFITADWKCPSSGMNDRMIKYQIHCLTTNDVLKFVVGSREDLDEVRSIIDQTVAQIFISPVFGSIEPREIVEYMQENEIFDARFQLQLHKFVWPIDARGV